MINIDQILFTFIKYQVASFLYTEKESNSETSYDPQANNKLLLEFDRYRRSRERKVIGPGRYARHSHLHLRDRFVTFFISLFQKWREKCKKNAVSSAF